MAVEAILDGHIRWADGDAAKRLHFPRLFEYFEDGEAELLRSVGYSMQTEGRDVDFPRVHVECSFKSVLRLYAPFRMHISIGRLGRSSIRYEYRVFADREMTELACEGSMTVVAVRNGRAVELPEDLRACLSSGGDTETNEKSRN